MAMMHASRFIAYSALLLLLLQQSTHVCGLPEATSAVGAYFARSSAPFISPAAASATDCSHTRDSRVCRLDAAALEVIRRLHSVLDDDKDGSVDAEEFDDYAREELRHVHSFEQRGGGAPSVDAATQPRSSSDAADLWRQWLTSEAHNWTVDQVCAWLAGHASLGQLEPLVREFGIDGPYLPLMMEPAVGQHPDVGPLARALSPSQRRKLAVRAQDLVLFGPPSKAHSPLKDFITACCLLVCVGGVWLGFLQQRFVDDHRRKVLDELASLKNAEQSLGDLQLKLSTAEHRNELDRAERQRVEDAYQGEIANLKEEAGRLSRKRLSTVGTDLHEKLSLAEQELTHLRALLAESERSSLPPDGELRQLLQLTYECELLYCNQSKMKADEQLARASEGLERLRRKQSSIVGVLRSAFNSAEMIDTVERDVDEAKRFVAKVKLEVSDRIQRWSRIEELLGISIARSQADSQRRKVTRPASSATLLMSGDEDYQPTASEQLQLMQEAARFPPAVRRNFGHRAAQQPQPCRDSAPVIDSASDADSSEGASSGASVSVSALSSAVVASSTMIHGDCLPSGRNQRQHRLQPMPGDPDQHVSDSEDSNSGADESPPDAADGAVATAAAPQFTSASSIGSDRPRQQPPKQLHHQEQQQPQQPNGSASGEAVSVKTRRSGGGGGVLSKLRAFRHFSSRLGRHQSSK